MFYITQDGPQMYKFEYEQIDVSWVGKSFVSTFTANIVPPIKHYVIRIFLILEEQVLKTFFNDKPNIIVSLLHLFTK